MDAQLPGSGGHGHGPAVVPPTCPFFRSVALDGALRPPIETPDAGNRCAAVGAPRPQSALQQELVCLTSDHVECPRYAQGLARLERATERREHARRLAQPTTVALGFLVLSAAASFGFVIARGGLSLAPAAVARLASDAPVAAAAPSEPSPGTPVPRQAIDPEPTVEPTPAPTAASTPPPTPAPTPAATPPPTPPPTPTPTQAPEERLFDDLEPCSGQSNCWIYTVRSGDSLWAIGERFGHSLDTIREWNPWTLNRGLRPGAEILLPPPNA